MYLFAAFIVIGISMGIIVQGEMGFKQVSMGPVTPVRIEPIPSDSCILCHTDKKTIETMAPPPKIVESEGG